MTTLWHLLLSTGRCFLFLGSTDTLNPDEDMDCEQPFPKEFKITGQTLSVGEKLQASAADGRRIGSFYRKSAVPSKDFVFENWNGTTMAMATTRRYNDSGVEYVIESDFVDEQYIIREIPSVPQDFLGLNFLFISNGVELAQIQIPNTGNVALDVTARNGKVVGTVQKEIMNSSVSWGISLRLSAEIPPWIIGFLASIIQTEYSILISEKQTNINI